MTRILQRVRRCEHGVTVVELAIVAAIFSVMLGFVYTVLDSATRTSAGNDARAQTLDELRGAVERVGKDVRQAVTVGTTSTSSKLTMQTLVAGVEVSVEYTVVSGRLERQVGTGTPVLVMDGLTNLAVFCYDPPACLAIGPSSDRPGMVRLLMAASPRSANAPPVTMATEIHLRNTGLA